MTKHLLGLAALAGMFPTFFAEHRRRKAEKAQEQGWKLRRSQAQADMERAAHNARIDAQKAAKRQAKAAKRAGLA